MPAPTPRTPWSPTASLTLALVTTLALGTLAASACGVGEGKTGARIGGSSSSGGASSGSSGSSGRSSGGSGSGSSSGSPSSSGSDQCAGTSSTATPQSVAIYIMMDRSASMDEAAGTSTKWEAVTSALSAFVGQPLDGTAVGLQYFPLAATSTPAGRVSCTAADYATPEVEIGPITQTGAKVTASMGSQTRGSGTPTSAALQGAIEHSRAWLQSQSGANYAAVVVLATDGEPTQCEQNLARIEAIAAAGLSGTPSIRTFVIGVGRSLTNLNGIAKAGGTTSAFLVDTGAGASDQFLKALNDIRGGAVRCSYVIPAPPAGEVLDPAKVNVEYQPGGGAAVTFGQVASAGDCGTKTSAWYYDNPAAPTAIHLCADTCTAVEADKAATVRIVLGCKTRGGEW